MTKKQKALLKAWTKYLSNSRLSGAQVNERAYTAAMKWRGEMPPND